ncbi:hypothetical protein ACVTW2_000677 [Escherichia coli]
MYNSKIRDAIESANADYSKLMAQATGTSTERHPQEEMVKNKWLAAEGFKPVITPEKEIKWIPNIPVPSQRVDSVQKGQNSMSNETLIKAYPFLQHAVDHYIPVMEDLFNKYQEGDHSWQYLMEQASVFMKQGIKEAVESTGGMSKQGKMELAKAASVYESAELIANSNKATEQLGGE